MRVGKDEKCCINCAIHWDREGLCEECRFEHKDHPSLFYRITRSPEVLAPYLVSDDEWGFHSSITDEGEREDIGAYNTEEEAIAATVKKLKEVGK